MLLLAAALALAAAQGAAALRMPGARASALHHQRRLAGEAPTYGYQTKWFNAYIDSA